jgi:hypothetical protein
MPLEFKVNESEYNKLDDTLKTYYAKNDDGQFYLDVRGAVSREKLNEFRDNNIDLQNKLKDYDGIDLEVAKSVSKLGLNAESIIELQDTQKKLRDKKLFDDKDIDGIVNARVNDRVNAMKTEHETEIAALTSARDSATGLLEAVMVDRDVTDAAIDMGVKDTALEDVKLRARQIFNYRDGAVVALDTSGNVVYGSDGSNPLSPKEWADKLRESAPHLFNESKGGGVQQGARRGQQDPSKMTSAQKISAGLAARG